MPIRLNGETSGSIELGVPAAVGSDLQVTLPATAGEVVVADSSGNITLDGDDRFLYLSNAGIGNSGIYVRGRTSANQLRSHTTGHFAWEVTGIEKMRLDSAGNLGVGTSVPSLTAGNGIHVVAVNAGQKIQTSDTGGWAYNAWADHTGSTKYIAGYRGSTATFGIRPGASLVSDAGLTVLSSGRVLVGKSASGPSTRGAEFRDGNANYSGIFTSESHTVVLVNRNGDDGALIQFRQDNVQEGTISVSGNSVSYNGGHLSRWSQLPGNAERTEILRGTVLTNLDEMCEWAYDAQDAVLYTEEDDLPEGVSVGDVKTPAVAAGTEDNEQLNRMKVSDVEGDPNVAGIFQGWDDDDDTYLNDFYCAMTGDFVIRIAQGTTVARGDLLMSAGDGTAKPQDDDIVRSKTIAKVTSTTVSETYSDGSYCVPCVLMAC